MEEELKCPVCGKIFKSPRILPNCFHSICYSCVFSIVSPFNYSCGYNDDKEMQEFDKLSMVSGYTGISDADSGVILNSRPGSLIDAPSLSSLLPENLQILTCPICKSVSYVDACTGIDSLPANRALITVINKYIESKDTDIKCQLCESEPRLVASVMCEQCGVFYCNGCKEKCHPERGPYASHNLVSPTEGKSLLRNKNKSKDTNCVEHLEEILSLYCIQCKTASCPECIKDGKHDTHDVQSIASVCKSQKADLSGVLTTLSGKAKSGTEFIQNLKNMEGMIEDNCKEFEVKVISQISDIIEVLKKRQEQLIENVRQERERKHRIFKQQIGHCTGKLQKTTAMLQYCIEVLKEADHAAFLQVSNHLLERGKVMDDKFIKEMEFDPRVSSEFEMSLDARNVEEAISSMSFFHIKPPGAPTFITEDCSSDNNCITLSWKQHVRSVVDGYTLEIDDGSDTGFKEVYSGCETICTVEGLQFDNVYHCRVKAFNHVGDSSYSEPVSLQTSDVAWFTWDPFNCHSDIILSNGSQTATCRSYDDCVVLGTVGFSRGVHYWEIVIERYENEVDPAFGIATLLASKNHMLGKDTQGWSMYVDKQRSWFMNAGEHRNRSDGGITVGSVIGVLLDLNKRTLSYYINDEPHGPVAFKKLSGIFFPAVSLNHNTTVTLRSGLTPPVESDSTDNDL